MSNPNPSRPDLAEGVAVDRVPEGGSLLGRVGTEDVLLVRAGAEIFAVGAHCTHYHGPLAEGLVVGDTIRCPWHHACFSLRSGDAVRAPALDPIDCWRVERRGDTVRVAEKVMPPAAPVPATSLQQSLDSVVIVGGGAAGLAAAEMLRRQGYQGPVTMLSRDGAPPCDRPNLSKDYLAGEAQEDWIPLRPPEFYADQRIELRLSTPVAAIDSGRRRLTLAGGEELGFGALLIATGAAPVRLPIPGADAAHVFLLRSFADSQAIIAAAAGATRAVIVGASFIGLEVAASLRTRGLAVDIVAPEASPLERVMGPDLGRVIRRLHEAHGVTFHLEDTVTRIDDRTVTLRSGRRLDADFVVMGVGVRPVIDLAEAAGLTIDRGIAVNEYLETSAPGIFAAGDVARWLDTRSGERRRVEHWVVAGRQGQVAARNILGAREPFDAVPFFWSQHYDVAIRYVGYAETWDTLTVDGDPASHDAAVTFARAGRTLAVATLGRDLENLRTEARLEGLNL